MCKQVTRKLVQRRVWAPGDEYLVVPEIQVFESDGFKEGERVEVTIEKIETVKSDV